MKEKIKGVLRALLHAFSQNLGWKIFSLVAAILLWSYIISNDPTITRDKTVSNVQITTSGLTVLQSRDLALLTDPATMLQDVRVRVQVPQASYSRVSSDTVRVELDLSQIRQTGRQEIELKGVSNYGEVVQITPSRLEVVVETLDQRNVPVNAELTGKQDSSSYWYNVSRTNPSTLTVTGPSSVVQKIASARVSVDVTGATHDYTWTMAPELLDNEGNVITQTLSRSSSSVSVGVSICPVKQLAVSDSIETTTIGELADGHQVARVEIQPAVISVAAEEELLAELDHLTITPVNVSGRRQSFSTTASLTRLNNIEHLSSEQVTVTVYIEETIISRTYQDVPLTVVGQGSDQKVSLSHDDIIVKVDGRYSEIMAMMRNKILAAVDVEGLQPGKHEVPISVSVDSYPDFTFELEPATVTVTVE